MFYFLLLLLLLLLIELPIHIELVVSDVSRIGLNIILRKVGFDDAHFIDSEQ